MADVTATTSSLSSTESSNQPAGTTTIAGGLDDNLRMIQSHIAAWRDGSAWGTLVLTSVAGTNTITATLATAGSVTFGPTALVTGSRFLLVPAATNTGATTLNITSPNGGSALGAKNIFNAGAACIGGELVIGVPVVVEYDGTQFNLIGGQYPANTTTASTFTDNGAGPGTSASVTITTQKVGGFVFINIPSFTLTTGTGAPATLTSNTAFPAAYQPAADVWLPCNAVRNNGVAVAGGVIRITTAGTIIVYRDGNLSAYTVSSSCGLNNNFAGCYKL